MSVACVSRGCLRATTWERERGIICAVVGRGGSGGGGDGTVPQFFTFCRRRRRVCGSGGSLLIWRAERKKGRRGKKRRKRANKGQQGPTRSETEFAARAGGMAVIRLLPSSVFYRRGEKVGGNAAEPGQ